MKDELNKNRQKGKVRMGPALLMEIFGIPLQIGSEKGYKEDSWWKSEPIQTDVQLMTSIKRHLKECETGIPGNGYTYQEYKPNGEPCPTLANHAYALFWNAAMLAMRVHTKTNIDDRWLIQKETDFNQQKIWEPHDK